MDIIKKRPQRDLNPCYRRERAVSWAGLDDRDLNLSKFYNLKKILQKSIKISVTASY